MRAQNQRLTAQVAAYESLVGILRQSSPHSAQIIDQALANSSALKGNEPEPNNALDMAAQSSDMFAESATPTMEGFIPLIESWQLSSAKPVASDAQLSSVQGVGIDSDTQRANVNAGKQVGGRTE